MPPKKATTKAASASLVGPTVAKEPKAKASAKQKENVELAASTVPAKLTARTSAPVKVSGVRRNTRRMTEQQEHAGSPADEAGAVQVKAIVTKSARTSSTNVTGTSKKESVVLKKLLPTLSKRPETRTSNTSITKDVGTMKATVAPKTSAAAPKKLPAAQKLSSPPLKKSAVAPKNTSTTAVATQKSNSCAASATPSNSSATTGGQGNMVLPQQFLDEFTALKAKLALSQAMVDKYKKAESAKPVEPMEKMIPEPPGLKTNLRVLMGLADDRKLYNICRAAVSAAMAAFQIPAVVDWRRQDSVLIAKVFALAKENEPRLGIYERNWATAEIIRSINKNKRGYQSKLKNPRKEHGGGRNPSADGSEGTEQMDKDRMDNEDDAGEGDDAGGPGDEESDGKGSYDEDNDFDGPEAVEELDYFDEEQPEETAEDMEEDMENSSEGEEIAEDMDLGEEDEAGQLNEEQEEDKEMDEMEEVVIKSRKDSRNLLKRCLVVNDDDEISRKKKKKY